MCFFNGGCTESSLSLALIHSISAQTEEKSVCDEEPKTMSLKRIQIKAVKDTIKTSIRNVDKTRNIEWQTSNS